MSALVRRVGSVLALAVLLLASRGGSADSTHPASGASGLRRLQAQAKQPEPFIALSMEVLALQALDTLQVTPAQLRAMAKVAAETAAKPRPRKPSSASDKYKKKLALLRDALVKHDADEIQVLTAELGELQATDKIFVDNMVDMTDPARKRAPEILKTLSPRQVALYLATFEGLLHDPVEGMYLTLENSTKTGAKEWADLRDGVAGEIADLLAGVDAKQAKQTAEKVAALLDKGHKIKEADLPKSRADLEKEMKQIMGNTGPIEIMRHFMERHIALLLSNPQLGNAIDARVKAMK
jgi:hypothetical protein